MYDVQQADIQLLRQRAKNIYTKIQLLNDNMTIMDEMQGVFIDGTVSIDSSSAIRRTFDGTIYIKDSSYVASETARVWMDKRIRVMIGFLYLRTNQIRWYSLGVYKFSQNSFTFDATTKTLKVSCLDLMSGLNGELGGTLIGEETQVPMGSNIRDAIVKTVTQLGECPKYRISYREDTVPYDLSWGTGSDVWTILEELRDLYYSYEMFFDEDTFVCQRIPMNNGDPVVIGSEVLDELVISEALTNSFTEVKNVVEIWGETTKSDYYADKSEYNDGVYTIYTNYAQVKDNKKFSFLAARENPAECSVKIVNTEPVSEGAVETHQVTYGPFVLYRSSVDDAGEDVRLSSGIMEAGKYYVVRLKKDRTYFIGQTQIHAIVRLVNEMPSAEQAQKNKQLFACDNIGYVVNPDSPFTVEKIGEKVKVCSGGDYEKIYTDELALQRGEYEIYVGSRLTDSLTVECILIPWLDVNNKVSYTARLADKKEERQYRISNISMNLGSGTMTITMVRFYPYYPNTVKLPGVVTETS